MVDPATEALLRVKSRPLARRRAGFAFTREPVELSRGDLGRDDLIGYENLLAIAEDPLLDSVFVDADGTEHLLDTDKIKQLREVVATLRAAQLAEVGNVDLSGHIADLLGPETEFQPASGAGGDTDGVTAPSVDPVVSSGEANASATSANSPGNETSSAEGGSTAGADEGKQPEETPVPPVAEQDVGQDKGPIAVPAAGKPAGTAKPKKATARTD